MNVSNATMKLTLCKVLTMRRTCDRRAAYSKALMVKEERSFKNDFRGLYLSDAKKFSSNYALTQVYEFADEKSWLLFKYNKETGGIGADMFCRCHKKGRLPAELDKLKFLIEVDRKGSSDAVYYSCANLDFEDFITEFGFNTACGSFSDISLIAPELSIAAVNLSSGYYNAHKLHEYINRAELETTIKKVSEMVSLSTKDTTPHFEYWESKLYRWTDDYYCSDDIYRYSK